MEPAIGDLSIPEIRVTARWNTSCGCFEVAQIRSGGPAEPMPGLINPGFNCEPFTKTRRVDSGPICRPSWPFES